MWKESKALKAIKIIINLDIFSLIFIIFVVYMFIMVVLPSLFNMYIYDNFLIEASSSSSNGEITTTSNSSGGSISKASDGAIMATSVAGGIKLAQKSPGVAAKAGIVVGSVVLGAGAIVAKNIAGNITENIGKSIIFFYFIIRNDNSKNDLNIWKWFNDLDSSKSFLDFDPSVFFSLSGNAVLDLLRMIQVFNNLEVFFLYLIIYSLIMLNISNSIIEKFLSKIIPEKYVILLIKPLNLFKKTGKVYIIIFFIMLSLTIYLSNHYFSFFVDNFDKICELYIKK